MHIRCICKYTYLLDKTLSIAIMTGYKVLPENLGWERKVCALRPRCRLMCAQQGWLTQAVDGKGEAPARLASAQAAPSAGNSPSLRPSRCGSGKPSLTSLLGQTSGQHLDLLEQGLRQELRPASWSGLQLQGGKGL